MTDTNSVDPATVEVLRNQVRDVAEEVQATVMNAAYSPLWQEAGDLSSALLNPDGEIVGQSERSTPIHIATMTDSTRAAVDRTGGREALSPGDVLMHNDPYAGNTHLPDFFIAKPVFVAGRLLGFAAVRGHWLDVGGSSPTSATTDAADLFGEGIRVPPVKLEKAGERNSDVLKIVFDNVRGDRDRRGDFNAQLAGVRRGHDRFSELGEEYGAQTVLAVLEQILSQDEDRMVAEIRSLPDGRFDAEDYLDGLESDSTPIEICAALHIDGDEIHVDFDGTHAQVERGINAPFSCTKAATQYAIKVTLDPGNLGTSGSYRPLSVTAPEGSLVNPRNPAPVAAATFVPSNRIYDTVLKAIVTIDPELAFAAGDGSSNAISYRSMETGELNRSPMGGGMGACSDRDGINGIRSGVGNTGIHPIERVEEEYDFLRIESFEIVPDTGGAGRFRGGNAVRRTIRFDHDCTIILGCERTQTRPFGVAGGRSGAPATVVHVEPDGEEVPLHSKTTKTIEAGSQIRIQSAGGGGYGDPANRPLVTVLSDVENGYVTPETAREEYDIDPSSPDYESLEQNH